MAADEQLIMTVIKMILEMSDEHHTVPGTTTTRRVTDITAPDISIRDNFGYPSLPAFALSSSSLHCWMVHSPIKALVGIHHSNLTQNEIIEKYSFHYYLLIVDI